MSLVVLSLESIGRSGQSRKCAGQVLPDLLVTGSCNMTMRALRKFAVGFSRRCLQREAGGRRNDGPHCEPNGMLFRVSAQFAKSSTASWVFESRSVLSRDEPHALTGLIKKIPSIPTKPDNKRRMRQDPPDQGQTHYR